MVAAPGPQPVHQLVSGLLPAIIMTVSCWYNTLVLSTISINTVLGVITNQGPRGDGWIGGDEVEENEVREFTGWIQGRPEDYIMNLQRHQAQQHRSKAQSNTRKTAVGPKLNLFSPGIKNDYEYLIKKQNEVANFTYKKGKTFLNTNELRLLSSCVKSVNVSCDNTV